MTVSLSGMTLHTNNDNEGGWGGTDGPDDYNNAIQGSNSESWQVSKNATETGTLTKSSALSATRGLLMFWMSSNLAPYYTDVVVDLQSTTNNYKKFTVANSTNKAIGGNFVPSVIDYVNKGASTGTFVPASFAVMRVILDNSSSGNIRSVINNWIDAIYYGPGHTISGTTTTDKIFKEAAAIDQNGTSEYGILEDYKGTVYSHGDIDLTGTALTSIGEALTFVDTINGYDRYNFDISGTVVFTNTSIKAEGVVDFDMDASGATAFSMTGGSITQANALTLSSGQTLKGVVLTDVNSSSIANAPENCVWNLSGLITLTGSGTLVNCTINEGTGTAAVETDDLDLLDGNTFVSDGTGHAVNMPTLIIADDTMGWDCTESGYAATDGSTGNETIKVNVDTGITLTVNVATGASTPTVYNTGAGTVSVVSGLITIAINVKDDSTGLNLESAHVWLGKDSDKSTIINGATDSSGNISTQITYPGSITPTVGWVRQMDLLGVDYTAKDISGDITSTGLSLSVRLTPI